ncbi:5'-nucleotidase SurE [Spirochaetia bacterium]|nr:5'-nucleotidase SurE [Spirochaetia bacterium]
MNILLTNDDGIGCDGIILLAEALRKLPGHTIFVLAPDGERSGVSQSVTLNGNAIRLRFRGNNTWTCSGTPADCAMLAALGVLPVKPDLVVSGINAGANMGTDLLYSGTAGAARQAAINGIPAIALSLVIGGTDRLPLEDTVYWDKAVAFFRDHLAELVSLWKEDTFINVNIPNSPDFSGVPEITFPSRRRYGDTIVGFDAPDGSRYCIVSSGLVSTEEEPGSDGDAISRNRVSVSPVFIHPVVRRDMCASAPDHCAAAPRPRKG